MKEAIASTYLYNIIFVFIAVVFAFIMGTLIYYKSMKVNKVIIASIEKYEGYNELAKKEIDLSLTSIGYGVPSEGKTCPSKNGVSPQISAPVGQMYCVYLYENDTEQGNDNYYSYGVTTYITINFPFVNMYIRIPIHSKSNRIFKFA